MELRHILLNSFMFLLLVKFLIQQYLSRRNQRHVLEHANSVPTPFQEQITLEEHQKAAKYTIAKARFGMASRLFDLVLILFWLPLGGAGFIDQYIQTLNLSEINQGLLFFAIFGIISMLLSLPFSLYSTFVLEEKFGFNKTTPKTFIQDSIKQILLSILIGCPFLYVILLMMRKMGDNWWLYAWAFFIGFQFILMWAFPKFIAPLFNKFSPLDREDFKSVIEQLCKRVGFAHSGVYVMDASKRSTHGNAYFTGFGKNRRIVFFDTLMESLNPPELEAVLAHELGHFKKKHILKMLIMNTIFTLIGFAVLGYLYQQFEFYLSFKFNVPSAHAALFIFTSIAGVYTFPLTPLMSFMSRKNEYEADAFAAENSQAQDLENALLKLYKKNFNTLTPDPLFSKFYYSHPSALERINFLNSLKKN
jgi:STE24 endopeptidase